MADNYTWSKMIAMDLEMHVLCDACQRDIEIDIAKMPPDGKVIGSRFDALAVISLARL